MYVCAICTVLQYEPHTVYRPVNTPGPRSNGQRLTASASEFRVVSNSYCIQYTAMWISLESFVLIDGVTSVHTAACRSSGH